MAGIAVGIAITSGLPVFFLQWRVGLRGKAFRIYKFRTMRASASNSTITVRGDSRVTRFGRFLRTYKLDELPQLVNILLGHMQIVGPRPEVPEIVNRWPASLRHQMLAVRPGLTDPASLHFRDEENLVPAEVDSLKFYEEFIMIHKLELSCNYQRSRTLGSDFGIILRTFISLMRPTCSTCACSICVGVEQ